MSAERPARLPAYVPPIAFLLFTAVAGLLQSLVSPTLLKIPVPAIGALRTAAEQARFASASFAWAAIAIITVASLVGALAYSGWVVRVSTPSPRALRRWAYWVLAIVALSLIADLSATTPAFWTSLIVPGDFKWPLTRATIIGNALGLASVGGLFYAAGSLIRAYRTTAIPQVVALERLRWLLILGAVATVCGVIEIRAVHQLPGAAIAAADMRMYRSPDTRTLRAAFVDEVKPASTQAGANEAAEAGKLPLVTRAIDLSFGEALPREAKSALRPHIASESAAGNLARSPNKLAELIMQPRDEAARAALVKLMDDVALQLSSFAGALFSVGLALLYLPAAAVLTSPRQPLKDSDAVASAIDDRRLGLLSNAPLDTPPPPPAAPATEDSQTPKGSKSAAPEPGEKPFSEQVLALAKVLTALAPLLAGLVGEAIKSILSVSG